MKKSSLLVRVLGAGAVVGMLSIGLLSLLAHAERARAEENVSRLMDRNTSKAAVRAESLEAFTLVTLKRVYFRYDESNLSSQEKIALNGLVNSFHRDTQSVIELRGYTDGMESSHTGTTLGITRSQTIARYLTASGIPPDRILLVATNGMSDEVRSMNPEHRRVDIRVFTAPGAFSALNTSREPAKPPKRA